MDKKLFKKIDDFKEYFCRKCPNNGAQVIGDTNLEYDVSYGGSVDCACPSCGEEFTKRIDGIEDEIDFSIDENFENPYCCDICQVNKFVERLKEDI